jgi:hypothetical protein
LIGWLAMRTGTTANSTQLDKTHLDSRFRQSHERIQPVVALFIGFMDVEDPEFESAEKIYELLDEAAAAIPRAVIILRKPAQIH